MVASLFGDSSKIVALISLLRSPRSRVNLSEKTEEDINNCNYHTKLIRVRLIKIGHVQSIIKVASKMNREPGIHGVSLEEVVKLSESTVVQNALDFSMISVTMLSGSGALWAWQMGT